MNIPYSELQKLVPSGIMDLYVLDSSSITGGAVDRFYPGLNNLQQPVIWQGNTYTPYPIYAEGFERVGRGAQPRPKLRVANIKGIVGALANETEDLVGAKLIRKRTFVKYLDAANFTGGNANADPNMGFPDEIWYVERKSHIDQIFAEFELCSAFDLQGIRIPLRQVIQNLCSWRYRSAECGYVGGPVADKFDVATSDAGTDDCSKRVSGCKLRFGATAELPFGNFPGAGLVR